MTTRWIALFLVTALPSAVYAQARGGARPATTRPAAPAARPATTPARPAAAAKTTAARPATGTAKAATTTKRNAAAGGVLPITTTPNVIVGTTRGLAPRGQLGLSSNLVNQSANRPVTQQATQAGNQQLTLAQQEELRRRQRAGGLVGGVVFLGGGGELINGGWGPVNAPLRPTSVNRPWAGQYPWYHGGWSGWGAWPRTWGGDEALAANYNNPHVVVVVQEPAPRKISYGISPALRAALDYSKPLNKPGPQTNPELVEAAHARLDVGRTAFRKGNFKEGLAQAERGIQLLPGDANLHEFRALALFAEKDYRGAAATLYAVLAQDPGWDWKTLSSFYPNTEAYTRQLRALESYVEDNEEDPAGHFVLAYHYLVLEEHAAALDELYEVQRLIPKDTLVPNLIEALEKGKEGGRRK